MPGVPCTVCRHRMRVSIDRQLVLGVPIRTLAAETGLSNAALGRHKLRCAGVITQSREERTEPSRATVALAMLPSREELGSMLLNFKDRLDAIAQKCEQDGAAALSIQALDKMRLQIESISRLGGHTVTPSQTVNVGVQLNITAADIGAALADRLEGVLPIKVIEAAEAANE